MGFIEYYTCLYRPIPRENCGYSYRELPRVATFIKTLDIPIELCQQKPPAEIVHQWNLLLWEYVQNPSLDFSERAIAFLSLRCYVSWSLTIVSQQLLKRYPNTQAEDLLSLLLGDTEASIEIILENGNLYHKIKNEITIYQPQYFPLAFDILQRWQPEKSKLNTWIGRISRSQNILKKCGIDCRTPWQIICRTSQKRINQSKYLSENDRLYIHIFREIYLSTLQEKRKNKYASFPEPTKEELQNIINSLATHAINYDSDLEILKKDLIQLAGKLRNNSIRLEEKVFNQDETVIIEYNIANTLAEEIEELIEDQFQQILYLAISCTMRECHTQHKQKHRHYAKYFYQCLYLRYCEGLSQKAIAKKLELGNQSNVSRIMINMKLQIENIEQICIHEVFKQVKKALDDNLDAEDLLKVKEFIRILLQQRTFAQTYKEIHSKNRKFTSEFVEAIQAYLRKQIEQIN